MWFISLVLVGAKSVNFERTNRAAFQEFLRLNFFELSKELRFADRRPVVCLNVSRSGECIDIAGIEESRLFVCVEDRRVGVQVTPKNLELGLGPRTSES
jgi:hypothetical protein